MSPQEHADSLADMISVAQETGGGRLTCCFRGPCAAHLAEQSPVTTSTIHFGHSHAVVPNYGSQELAVAFTRAAIDMARLRIGAA